MLSLLGITLFALLVVSYLIIPQADHAREARDALCAGNIDFVYGTSRAGYIYYADTPPAETQQQASRRRATDRRSDDGGGQMMSTHSIRTAIKCAKDCGQRDCRDGHVQMRSLLR